MPGLGLYARLDLMLCSGPAKLEPMLGISLFQATANALLAFFKSTIKA